AGTKYLTVRAIIPDTGQDNRSRNMMIAMANRQAIFKNDCASCHAHPTVGKKGEALYQAACGICHEAEHRASMVPDLTALKNPTSKEYWELWVTKGKPGTLMPAFAKSEGGPLDEEQVASLVDYLTHHYPPRPRVQAETPHHDD
ncbi:MAG: cytochrome c, partial [Verrucomicrobiota bacterium]